MLSCMVVIFGNGIIALLNCRNVSPGSHRIAVGYYSWHNLLPMLHTACAMIGLGCKHVYVHLFWKGVTMFLNRRWCSIYYKPCIILLQVRFHYLAFTRTSVNTIKHLQDGKIWHPLDVLLTSLMVDIRKPSLCKSNTIFQNNLEYQEQ